MELKRKKAVQMQMIMTTGTKVLHRAYGPAVVSSHTCPDNCSAQDAWHRYQVQYVSKGPKYFWACPQDKVS